MYQVCIISVAATQPLYSVSQTRFVIAVNFSEEYFIYGRIGDTVFR